MYCTYMDVLSKAGMICDKKTVGTKYLYLIKIRLNNLAFQTSQPLESRSKKGDRKIDYKHLKIK